MTVEETRCQLEQAKRALDEAIQQLTAAGGCYKEAGEAIVACGGGSVHPEPDSAGAALAQAKDKANSTIAAAQAANANIGEYSSSI